MSESMAPLNIGFEVPVLEKRNSKDQLENFAQRIEMLMRKAKDKHPFAMERLMCRLMTGKDRKVAALVACKWVEWKYGKPKETIEHSGNIEVKAILIPGIMRADDANKLT